VVDVFGSDYHFNSCALLLGDCGEEFGTCSCLSTFLHVLFCSFAEHTSASSTKVGVAYHSCANNVFLGLCTREGSLALDTPIFVLCKLLG